LTNLVERLRSWRRETLMMHGPYALCEEAAAEIERLLSEITALSAKLSQLRAAGQELARAVRAGYLGQASKSIEDALRVIEGEK